MSDLSIGQQIPDFSTAATGEQSISRQSLAGKWAVIYFYPRDNTPGCTREGQDFRDLYADFQRLDCEIIGVSRDSLGSHEKFAQKQNFPFPLAADEDSSFCNAFGVIGEKKMYGKTHKGIVRSTFLIDPQGVLVARWKSVKVAGHAEKVLEKLRQESGQASVGG